MDTAALVRKIREHLTVIQGQQELAAERTRQEMKKIESLLHLLDAHEAAQKLQ